MASNETAKMENSKISLDVFAPSHCAIWPKKFDKFFTVCCNYAKIVKVIYKDLEEERKP